MKAYAAFINTADYFCCLTSLTSRLTATFGDRKLYVSALVQRVMSSNIATGSVNGRRWLCVTDVIDWMGTVAIATGRWWISSFATRLEWFFKLNFLLNKQLEGESDWIIITTKILDGFTVRLGEAENGRRRSGAGGGDWQRLAAVTGDRRRSAAGGVTVTFMTASAANYFTNSTLSIW